MTTCVVCETLGAVPVQVKFCDNPGLSPIPEAVQLIIPFIIVGVFHPEGVAAERELKPEAFTITLSIGFPENAELFT